MHAQDLPGFAQTLAQQPVLAKDEFWSLTMDKMVPMQVEFFYFRAGQLDKRNDAIALIEKLQECMTKNVGMLTREDMVLFAHYTPTPSFMLDDLIEALSLMTDVRQQAVLAALETGLEPEAICGMRWKDEVALPDTPTMRHVVEMRAAHRHPKVPYVFWEWSEHRASPIFNLRQDAEMAFARSWPSIVNAHANMKVVSPSMDVEDFFDQVALLAARQLVKGLDGSVIQDLSDDDLDSLKDLD